MGLSLGEIGVVGFGRVTVTVRAFEIESITFSSAALTDHYFHFQNWSLGMTTLILIET